MIPNEVRVKMTRAQMTQYIYEQSKFHDYERRERRLAMLKKYDVRVEVTKSIRKCYVKGRLVICLPYADVCKAEYYTALHVFNVALQAVLDALYTM